MTCEEFETSLADFLDGTLAQSERAALDAHVAGCAACEQFKTEVTAGLLLAGRAEAIVPPPDLVTRIAYLAPVGRTRRPYEHQSWLSKLTTRWVQPILQPRFAMGMAMTILSFAMLERCTGIRVQRIEPTDLSPVKVWGNLENRTIRFKDRAVKYYENIRFVYDIEVRLREMEEQQAAQNTARQRQGQQTKAGNGDQTKSVPGAKAQGPTSVTPEPGPMKTNASGEKKR